MIMRVWSGRADAKRADDYARHVTGKVLPALNAIAGYRGANVLRRASSGRVEFVVMTLWTSLDAVRAFAGEDLDRAVVEPEARAALDEFDETVRHYDIMYADSGVTSSLTDTI